MTGVACERRYRWRSITQDLGSHQLPPAAALSSHHHHLARNVKNPKADHTGVIYLPYHDCSLNLFNLYQPSVTSSHSYSVEFWCNVPDVKYSVRTKVDFEAAVSSRMHAQATSGSFAVSTFDDVSTIRKPSTPLTEASIPDHQASPAFCAAASFPNQPADSSCHESSTRLDNTGIIANVTIPATLSANTIAIADSTNQNSCSWVANNLSNFNNSSRGSLSSKNKSGCPRRRLIDEDGYIKRAACICVNKEETKILLVSSKKDPCVWLVPGGGLEVGEDAIMAAKREAWEEAGIRGHIIRYLGLFESFHHSGVKKHRTAVYIFLVTEEHTDFPEATLGRRRQWFSLEEALLHLAHNRPFQSAYLQLLMMSKLKVVTAS